MALLEIDRLTMRFGGLTAVNEVDIRVEEGDIFSIIGPNGAGKTTVFNGITAIYEPTAGAIRCRGHDMRRPLRPLVFVACALIGLVTGLAAAVISVNVDDLWRATIKENYRDPSRPFAAGKAWRDLRGYVRGELRLEERGSRWAVVTYNAERSLGVSPRTEEAGTLRENIREMMRLAGAERTLASADSGWVVRSDDGERILATFETREDAVARLRDLAEVAREARGVGIRFRAGLVLGFLMGAFGTFSVWRQTRRLPHIVAGHGLARTFQNIRLFQQMTVLENVLMGMDRHLRVRGGRAGRILKPGGLTAGFLLLALAQRENWFPPGLQVAWTGVAAAAVMAYAAWVHRIGAFSHPERRIEEEGRRQAEGLLEFVGLADHAGVVAKNLPYGDQRRLEIARALATRPVLLLLDEPAAGMNPIETAELMKLIRRIRDTGTTVLLIEHHMRVVMGISDRIAVLDYGSKIAEGTPEEVRANPQVIEAYLGKEEVN